jgi:chromosome partitioning protein
VRTIQLVQENLNPGLRIEGVLLTMFDARVNLSQQVADEARKFFSDRVYRTMIPRNVRLSEAHELRQADHPLRWNIQRGSKLPCTRSGGHPP